MQIGRGRVVASERDRDALKCRFYRSIKVLPILTVYWAC